MTRFYLHHAATTQSGTLPSSKRSTPDTTSSDVLTLPAMRTLDTTIGTAQSAAPLAPLASTVIQNNLAFIGCSKPLAAQTIPASLNPTINGACNESNLNANLFATYFLNVYVWRPSTGAIVADLSGGNASPMIITASEPTATSSEQVSAGVFAAASNPSITTQDGDILVFELGSNTTQAMSSAYTGNFFYDGTTVTTTNNTVVSNHAAFVEYTGYTFTFYTAPAGTASGSGSASAAGSAIAVSAGTVTGSGSASGTGRSTAVAAGSAAGAGSASAGVINQGAGSAAGAGSASAAGNALKIAAGTVAGAGTATATGQSTAAAAGTIAGAATETGTGKSTAVAAGTATGSATETAAGKSTAVATGSAAGAGSISGGPFTPAAISGLIGWYDAQDASSITQSSGAVSQWNDKSVSGINVAQSNAANKPNYSATGYLGRLPGVTFNSANSTVLQAASAPFSTYDDFTLFVQVAPGTPAGYQFFYSVMHVLSTNVFVAGTDSSLDPAFVCDSITPSINVSGVTAPSAAEICFRRDTSGTLTFRINGTDDPTSITTSPSVVSGAPDSVYIGQKPFGNAFNGTIGEIIFYNRLLNSTEIAQVEGYLSQRWSVGSVATATGSAAIVGAGTAIVTAAGTAAGSATVSAAGKATVAAAGTVAGSGSASGTGRTTAAAAGTAAGSGTAAGTGRATAAAAGSVTGSGTATGTVGNIGTAAGAGSASGVGRSTAAATGTASGAATVTAGGIAIATAAGSITGAAAVSGAGKATSTATGTTAGAGSATAQGRATVAAAGTVAGAASVAAQGTEILVSQGSANGAATVTGQTRTLSIGAGTVTGSANVAATGSARVTGSGAATTAAVLSQGDGEIMVLGDGFAWLAAVTADGQGEFGQANLAADWRTRYPRQRRRILVADEGEFF